jgi:hypothetical protein
MAAMMLGAAGSGDTLVDFRAETPPQFVVWHDTHGEFFNDNGDSAWQVRFDRVDWPNVYFQAPNGAWDWQAYAGVAVSLYNPGDEPVPVAMRVDNAGADGTNHCNNASGSVPPRGRIVLGLRFNTGAPEKLWGMRGVPSNLPLGQGSVLDASKITAFQVYLPRPQKEFTLHFERAWLVTRESVDTALAMPFIDRFGQYKHADWPGKLKDEQELAARRDAEAATLAAQSALPGRDTYGGWAEGPTLAATGWFRTEQVDGKWWLVTPEGRLFLSIGVDCVGVGERTFVEGRRDWFEWLPADNEAPFSELYQDLSGAHSGADPIGGKGRTFSFYTANVLRKYGPDWQEPWRRNTYARLRAWGFNTIANWSQWDVLENSPMPFVASAGIGGVRPVEGGAGYWAKMMDPYDPAFPAAVDNAIKGLRAFSENPLCIGYFVDNELAWEEVRLGVLNSSLDQPCRQKLIEQLQSKYPSLEALNAAWATTAQSWDTLKPSAPLNAAATADLDAFVYTFARQYFQTVRDAIRKYAPNQLYLGCRFANDPEPAVRACADIADVVSFNLYSSSAPQDRWTGKEALGKPIIIGEFHFGALDRGMFHTGLVATQSQAERAQTYTRYLQSVADHPALVGCHWFQYIDEPTTGRWFDGENYNIGFLDVTDTPYPELVEAARKVHGELYTRRYSRGASQAAGR